MMGMSMTMSPHLSTTASERTDAAMGRGLRGRLALSGLSFVYVLLAVPAVALLVFLTVGLSAAVIGVGLVLLLIFMPLAQGLGQVHRRLSGEVLGQRIEAPYLPSSGERGWRLLRHWWNDPARWRDFAWTWMSATLGWVIAWLAVGLFLGVLWYALFPLLYALTPDGVLGNNYGIVKIDTQAKAFLEWGFLLIAGPLWWTLTPVLMRWRAELDRALLGPSRSTIEARVRVLQQTRAEQVDHSANELRRIERDLHDGAQARLVALGMSLGMAEQLVERDPQAAAQLLAEARATTTHALGDLRSVVRGILPPVLADRGLAGAVQAVTLDLSLPVVMSVDLPGRVPPPVESAVYFAITELLTNVAKHARATRVAVDLGHADGRLRAVVTDDGIGGATQPAAGGLAGVARRLAAFDGTILVESPVGGPTRVTLEVPCELSSQKTTPSSGTD